MEALKKTIADPKTTAKDKRKTAKDEFKNKDGKIDELKVSFLFSFFCAYR